MRILVVSRGFPWPVRTGAAMRLANVIEGLAGVGEVELFAMLTGQREASPDPNAPLARWATVLRPPVARPRLRNATWLAAARAAPLELHGRDYGPVREAFRRWARPPYDLVWFRRVESYWALGSMVRAPAVVDIDDLEDHMARTRLASLGRGGGPTRAWRRAREARNARLWEALQAAVARRAAVVIVCSDLDRHRLAQPNVVVIPNGFVEPSRPVGRITVGDPPTVLLQGFLRYRPNIEAARELVRIIAPRVRERIPLLQVRLVGAGGLETVGDLHDPPRTVVTGWVDDLGKELERSDLVAVPLRLGSGTRIKILEALAHRIPVVSTPIGAEGLELEDGRHLLLADAPEAFADSCVRALTDLDLRRRLVGEGVRLFLAHYRWSAIRPRITDLASAVATGRRAE